MFDLAALFGGKADCRVQYSKLGYREGTSVPSESGWQQDHCSLVLFMLLQCTTICVCSGGCIYLPHAESQQVFFHLSESGGRHSWCFHCTISS